MSASPSCTCATCEFGASPNAFIESLAKNARRGCYPRAVSRRADLLDDRRRRRRQRGEHAVRGRRARSAQGQLLRSSRSSGRATSWLTWADVAIGHSLADGYLPIPSVEWKHRSIELTTTAYASGAGRQRHDACGLSVAQPDARARQQVTLALVGAAVPGQSAGAVSQHRGRREPDPGSRVREWRGQRRQACPACFRARRRKRSARSRSRRIRRASGCQRTSAAARSARRERLRVGRIVVRRRSGAGREPGDRARLAAASRRERPSCRTRSASRRDAVARKAESRRADRAAASTKLCPTRCAPRSRTC